MEYKKVKDYDGYEVSEYGDVISYKRGRVITLRPQLDKDGYKTVNLYNNGKMKTVKVHRLVCVSFNEGNGETVNHKDFNKLNNHYSNLEFCSSLDNIKHAWDSGKINPPKGKNHYKTKITEKDKTRIIEMKKRGIPNNFIAEVFGIHPNTIYKYYRPTPVCHLC